MKLWNGWGTEGTPYHLAPSSAQYLESIVGKGSPTPDAQLENVLATVPPSRLVPHPLVNTDAEERVRHARGQSLPDWIAMRSGQVGAFPDGVAYPLTDQDVQSLLVYARDTTTRLIPYGGGSSVVGHVNVIPGDQPVLTVDLTRMAGLLDLDETSQLATFGAGIRGPLLEEALNGKGYTLGHFPQSFEYSTLGGWVASRSVGTQCFYYGDRKSTRLNSSHRT